MKTNISIYAIDKHFVTVFCLFYRSEQRTDWTEKIEYYTEKNVRVYAQLTILFMCEQSHPIFVPIEICSHGKRKKSLFRSKNIWLNGIYERRCWRDRNCMNGNMKIGSKRNLIWLSECVVSSPAVSSD